MKLPILSLLISSVISIEVDPNGYVMFCPCMGRFGNQIEHYLGSMAFTKALNRTLVLPPFIEYHPGQAKAVMVDFEKYFRLESIERYQPVVSMHTFMTELAPIVWPLKQRKVLCWSARASVFNISAPEGCHAKEGNPFGPFWDHSRIQFVDDIFFGDHIELGHDISRRGVVDQWRKKFPPSSYPVLPFASAPASFPARPVDRPLQRYFKWSALISQQATHFIENNLMRPFVGIHLRNNVDWINVCKHVREGETTRLFGSAQCTGDRNELRNLTTEMCGPSLTTILDDVDFEVKRVNAKSVFVASDHKHYIDELTAKLAPFQVSVHRREPDEPHVSLAILGLADHFIGNCVSTFSSIVYRERKFAYDIPKSTSFFGCRTDHNKEIKSEL